MLYRNSMHGAVRKASTGVIGFKGVVQLGRRTRAFWSMDPGLSAREARYTEHDISRMVNKATSDMIKRWVKDHDYDVDSLCAAGIEVRFEFEQARHREQDCVNVLAEMYAAETNQRIAMEEVFSTRGSAERARGDVF